ncbi:MAG: putative bifunctional diguanylate cyclase/phosphodiesterase [Acidimicrobiales bacterium]
MGTSGGFTGCGGPAPEIGVALRDRAEEVCDRLVSWWRWRSESTGQQRALTLETDICHASRAGTLAVADYLVTGREIPRDRSEAWVWVGEAPLAGRITLSGLTKLYIHWRAACEDVLREEVRRRGAGEDALEQCLRVLQVGFDVSIVRMTQRFEMTRRGLEEEVAEQRARLEHQALHDPLTGLANRVLLLDRIQHATESAARRGTGAVVLFMDLDFFKAVNDASGHSAGDRLLLDVARRLQSAVRPEDTIARLGGDEFVVLCEDVSDPAAEGLMVARRIIELFEEPFTVSGRSVVVRASIGVAPAGVRDCADALLARADHAMYRAKQLGRGRVELYDPAIDDLETRHGEVAAALSRALEDQLLRLVYQPLCDVVTRRLLAREALVRWHDPVLGDVAPSEMIPLAESARLITGIGRWVLSVACKDCAAWRRDGEPDVGVTVNVSGLQLASAAFPGEVEGALKENGLPPDALTVELTEALLMTDRADALERLRALGVRIAVDDFGTGYSSLSWLARLPVDVVKVDRSFVAQLGTADRYGAIVDAMIHLAHALGLDVVAEGVETDAQLEHLARLGCDAAQGFLLGHAAAVVAGGT